MASHAIPVATATAEPPEEPPALKLVFQGFRVVPKTGLKVCPPAHSGTLDLAIGIAPFCSRRAIVASDFLGTLSEKMGEP